MAKTKKTFKFNGDENLVTVDIKLEEKDGKNVFTASANVWNRWQSDIIMGGQCFDRLKGYRVWEDEIFQTIRGLWKKHHLNDMHIGTPEQEKAVARWRGGSAYEYTAACDYLKSIGLFEVEHEGKAYKYGHGWLYQEIPAEDLHTIKCLLAG